MKKNKGKAADELRPEYDIRQLLKGAVRGKYTKRFHAGTNLVIELSKVGGRKARMS